MSSILELVKTKNKSVELLQALDEGLKHSYSKNFNVSFLKNLPINLTEKTDVPTELKKAKEEILSAKLIDLTMYIEPEDAFISKLYNWFVKNGFKNFLLNIHIDTKIGGGVLISFNGKYVDLSLRKKVYDYARK
jgi:F0F1-type ATP synthase delta subunit